MCIRDSLLSGGVVRAPARDRRHHRSAGRALHRHAEGTAVGLPVSIRDVLRARLARLGAETALVLSDAAVIGQEFDVDLLARTTELDGDHVLDLLEAAGRTALVAEAPDPPGRFRFAQALVLSLIHI